MNERDFTIGQRQFQLSKIDPFKQFHIVRRLGPILGDIIPVAQKIKAIQVDGEKSQEQMLNEIGMLAKPLMKGFSELSDDDANLILFGLCSSVSMHQEQFKTWAKISDGKRLMFEDLDLSELLQIAGRAFMYNLSGFFNSAHQTS